MKIENVFKVFFVSIKISEANFIRFVEDHLQRLIANNPGGAYATLISALTTLMKNLMTAIDQRNIHQAWQESRTASVDQLIAEFKTMMSRLHTSITDIWDENHAYYEEFFPRGLEEYTTCTKGNIVSLMNRFIAACDARSTLLPTGIADGLIALKATYETSRSNQLGMIGSTDGNRVDVAEARQAVAVQVTKNMHTLAIDFIGRLDKVPVYFDQSIITRPIHQNGAAPEPEILAEAVAAATKAVILHGGFDSNTIFRILNTGSVNLKFYTANLPDDVVPTNALDLAPGEEDYVTAAELGAEGNLFLMVSNEHATIAGSYEVSEDIE